MTFVARYRDGSVGEHAYTNAEQYEVFGEANVAALRRGEVVEVKGIRWVSAIHVAITMSSL